MPLDSPEEYEKLGEHLKTLDPKIKKFCDAHGFMAAAKASLSRYPERRFAKVTDYRIAIDLWMEVDRSGNRFEVFFPEIPYSMGCSASSDRGNIRYYVEGGHMICKNVPFRIFNENFSDYLKVCINYFDSVSYEYIEKHGKSVQIST